LKAHYVEFRSFAQVTEDSDLVERAMRTFLPEDTEVETQEAEGHFGNPVRIIRAKIENADEIRYFLKKIDHLKDRVLDELDLRLDDCNLWIRLDKEAALRGEAELVEADGVVARIKVAAYPAKRENAAESARELLS